MSWFYKNYTKWLDEGCPIKHGVYHLNLSKSEIDELCNEIDRLPDLQTLDLSFNYIKTLPSSIVNLQNIVRVDVRSNRLTEFPSELLCLKKLNVLSVFHNDIKTVPPPDAFVINDLFLEVDESLALSSWMSLYFSEKTRDTRLARSQLKCSFTVVTHADRDIGDTKPARAI